MDSLIEQVLKETDVAQNPYFRALNEGSFEKPDFVETQIQFHSAVDFFSRPMAAVAAKIPTAQRRKEILRNVWEEHGEGEDLGTHGSTFLEFLHRLDGVSKADVERRVLWPEVRIFNTTLVGAAVLDDYLVGVAMMGIIERMFVDISNWIGKATVNRGWIPRDRLVHYNVHEELDIRHADDFFDVLRPEWAEPKELTQYSIAQGLRLGASVFDGLYRGLYHSRKRRLYR
ncbi:MAG: iron-containing redox enzyme family protein [Myxococcota bacterium]